MMLIHVDADGNSVRVQAEGTIIDLLTQTVTGLRAMYESIEENAGNDHAEAYKDCLTRAFADGVVFEKDVNKLKEKRKVLQEELDLNDEELKQMFKKLSDDLAEILK